MADPDFVPLNYRQLPGATSEEIRAAIQPGNSVIVSQTDLVAELDRRMTREAADRMERLTRDVRDMTAHIRLLTIAALLLAIVATVVALVSLAVALR